jgi:hypothetical protein
MAASTSSSTGQPPGRTHSPSRIPSTASNEAGSSYFGPIAHASTGCGPAITFSNNAQSATVRASGPLWQ